MFWRHKKDDKEQNAERTMRSFGIAGSSLEGEPETDEADEEELTAQEDLLNAEEALKMTQDALSAIEQETAQTAAEYFAEIMSTFNQTVQEEADKGRRSALLATSGEFDGPVEELEPAAAQAWARVSEKLMALGLKIEIVKNDGTEREYGNYELMVRW